MTPKLALIVSFVAGAGVVATLQPDESLPQPALVTPGLPPTGAVTPAPSDAIVLFDGTSMSHWLTADGKAAAPWTPEGKVGGFMQCVPGSGQITSKEHFADAQIHVEFATPEKVAGDGQGRGNSGVFLQGRYEIQVLDSYNNKTYANGQCASVYGQHAPLVNVSRKPGEWQTFDIIYRAAKFDAAGALTAKPRVTVLHNGVLVQDNVEIQGSTSHVAKGPIDKGDGPISLQDHGNTVRYRNIWVRKL
ncbi:MAG: DUF1080 domain-containing protein [Planctomycetota bacterium]